MSLWYKIPNDIKELGITVEHKVLHAVGYNKTRIVPRLGHIYKAFRSVDTPKIVKVLPGPDLTADAALRTDLARQGILFLSTMLTTEIDKPIDVHRGLGWEEFTRQIIQWLDQQYPGLNWVFVSDADLQTYGSLITSGTITKESRI